jgi:hypothetical protein
MANFQEPEEMEYNPLGESVNEKSYTRPNVVIDANELNTPIPEPTYQAENISASSQPKPKEPKKPIEQLNPEMEDLSNKDKKDSAKYVAETIVGGYEFICGLANRGLLFNENKLKKLQASGEVDLSMQLPIGNGQYMTILEFIQEYNEQNKNALAVTQEFKDEIIPVLTKVLEKRGIGMTIEQKLLFIAGKDVATKAIISFQLVSIMKEMQKDWKEFYLMNQQAQAQPQPQPQPQPTYTPPPSEPIYTPTEEVIDEFEEEENARNDFEESLKVNNIVEQMVNPQPKQIKRGRPKKNK